MTEAVELGTRFARALAAKDGDELRRVLRADIDFRAMTPSRFWEAGTADAVVDEIMLGTWFEPTDEIRELLAVDSAAVGHRHRVGYRLRVDNAFGEHLVEQQAYYEEQDGQIVWLRIMCAGYMPVAVTPR